MNARAQDRIEVVPVPCRTDNYAWLLRDEAANVTGILDPSDAAPVMAMLDARGWRLTHIFSTHHHDDHVGGNLVLKSATGATVTGAAHDAHRIPGIDIRVDETTPAAFGPHRADILVLPGHTLGAIAFVFPDAKGAHAFVGDTLFSLGCGRLFEGTAPMLWDSLQKLTRLAPDTRLYGGHEYTLANARFALSLDPGNPALAARAQQAQARRDAGHATMPTTLADEMAANPFLRADAPDIRAALEMPDAPAAAVFAELRRRKDVF